MLENIQQVKGPHRVSLIGLPSWTKHCIMPCPFIYIMVVVVVADTEILDRGSLSLSINEEHSLAD